MRLRTCVARVGVLAGIVAAGCSGKDAPPPVCSAPQGAASAAQSLAADDASFAAAFYGPAVAAAGAGQNAIFSPYSISATLMMVDVGAAGQTDTQMQSVLELPANASSLAPAYATLACGDESDGSAKGDQLSIANSLWGQSGVAFESAFTSILANGYDAPLQQADFQDDPSGAASTINAWVSGQTQGMIPTLLQGSDVNSTTRLVLVDAIYFKGTWATGFDPDATQPAAFTRSDGSTEQVPTMQGTVNLATGADHGFTPYELPYKGGGLAMDFLLPDATSSLAALESSLTAQSLASALASIGPNQQVQLFLPKFSFTTRLELVPILQGMGMTDVFEPQVANLSGMDGGMDLYVGAVVHQALVEVDESGTVAAAATSASGDDAFGGAAVPPEVQIDRPFLFLIRDIGSGSILFMGRVEDPAQ